MAGSGQIALAPLDSVALLLMVLAVAAIYLLGQRRRLGVWQAQRAPKAPPKAVVV